MVKILSLIMFVTSLIGNQFDKELRNYLAERLTSYNDFEYELIRLPKGVKRIKVLENEEFQLNGDIAYVPVEIYNNQHNIINSFVTVRLKLMKKVYVAVDDIKPETKLTPDLFEEKIMDVSTLRGAYFLDKAKIKNFRNVRKIYKGSILVEELMEKIPDIVSGDVLEAISQSGSVAVSTKAFAREDGNVGERIKIRTIDNIQFTAEIIDNNKVIVLE